jgi:hypothetical protein
MRLPENMRYHVYSALVFLQTFAISVAGQGLFADPAEGGIRWLPHNFADPTQESKSKRTDL